MSEDGAEAQRPEEFGIGQLFYLTSEAIVAADLRDELIVLWNPAAERLFGYPAGNALGMRLDTLVPPELRDEHRTGIDRYRGGGESVLVGAGPVVVPAVTMSGERRDVALSLTDVSTIGGTGRVVLAVLRDVTDQLRVERELASANQAMREFVATASHDLRSPLTSVLGYSQLLLRNADALTAEQRQEMLEAIRHGAEHATRLVGDLLTLSQIQSAALTVQPEVVAVAAVVGLAKEQTRSDAAIEVADDLVVFADPDHLCRILANYLSNALHYGKPPIRVVATGAAGRTEIRVCDGGEGVPETFVDRLFTAFARAEPTRRDGTGLGLSIVKGLAVANGGDVFYERTPELGSCFGVVLPQPPAMAPIT